MLTIYPAELKNHSHRTKRCRDA